MSNTRESNSTSNQHIASKFPYLNISTLLKTLPFIAITTNILIFSSALKLADGDYYLAGEIIKNINPKTWWISNLSTVILVIFFCISPLFHYLSQALAIKMLKTSDAGWRGLLLTHFITAVAVLLTAYYVDGVLGFKSFLPYGYLICFSYILLSLIFGYASLKNSEKDGLSKEPLKIFPVIFSLSVFILSPTFISDSTISGQSCLVKQEKHKGEPIATIIPIEMSKDSLKAIYLEKPGYIKYTQIDESYLIYPYSCDKLNFSSVSSDPNATG